MKSNATVKFELPEISQEESHFTSESINTGSDDDGDEDYDEESDDGMIGINKDELDEAIQKVKEEILQKEVASMIEAAKLETLQVVRKEFDQDELQKIVKSNVES